MVPFVNLFENSLSDLSSSPKPDTLVISLRSEVFIYNKKYKFIRLSGDFTVLAMFYKRA